MRSVLPSLLRSVVAIALAMPAAAQHHHHLDATLAVPFDAAADGQRRLVLSADFPQAPAGTVLFWQVNVRAPDGRVLDTRVGELALPGAGRRGLREWQWPDAPLVDAAQWPAGFYDAELTATALEPWLLSRLGTTAEPATRVARALAWGTNGVVAQAVQFRIGNPPAPVMPPFQALPTGGSPRTQPAGSLPYTVYLGNFHSQSNHSDGGGNVATCNSSQSAQSGQYGPADAFAFADAHGLDFLMVSEHNHYFDGSGNGTNANGSATAAISLYHAGRQAALDYNATHPGFVALYGMEWGVIDGGGHLNVLGSDQLWGWESNGMGQLFGEVLTPRSDYPTLYAQMQTAGTIGQFNHPAGNQFLVGGIEAGYSAVADEVMVLAEILNTSAFSSHTDEGETSQSTYGGRFNTFLERGFHVAPSSNQDNHCANWGASAPNRTGVLIPNGTLFNTASLMAALRDRRVYATADKTGQIILTADGHVMGARFTHHGLLTLTVAHASSSGQTVSQVLLFEGVPQRNGAVTQLANTAVHTHTPALGEHVYYARITQSNGKQLWSAPIWVTQVPEPPDPLFADSFE